MNDPASIRTTVSQEEWRLRTDLAACYRLVAMFHWDDLIFTHISARLPGPDHHFLINPYGMMFDEITASSLVKVDLEGRKVVPSPYEINPAGTLRFARPICSASSASTGRPVRIRSSARLWPIRRGRRTVPPSISGTPQRRQ